MKKSVMLLLAFCGLIALLVAPGIVAADPVVVRTDPTIVDFREGKVIGEAPDAPSLGSSNVTTVLGNYGAYAGVDQNGHNIYVYDPESGLSETHGTSGLLILAESQQLVDMYKSNTMPTTLAGLLDLGPCMVSDIIQFNQGVSFGVLWSDPFTTLLNSEFHPVDSTQAYVFTSASDFYKLNNMKVILESDTTPTIYKPAYGDPGYMDANYWYPYGISSYEYHIYSDPRDDDCGHECHVPEPGALLLLGFGLMTLAGMRRVDRLFLVTTRR